MLILIFIIIFGLFLMSYANENVIYYNEYMTIIFSYYVCTLSYFFVVLIKKNDIFNIIHLVSFLYLCLFILAPLVFIINDDTDLNGVQVMAGCQKASLIFTGGYLSLLFGYMSVIPQSKYIFFRKVNLGRKPTMISLFFWVIGFISSLYFLLSSGFSLMYIFTFGSDGTVTNLENQSLFLINFTYFMIAPAIYLMFNLKSKSLSVLIFILTLTQYMIRGTRFIIVIFLISTFLFWYRTRNILPSTKMIITSVLIFISGSAYMQYFRNSIRTGSYDSLDKSKSTSEIILNSFVASFDIYKPFYGLVSKYPSIYSHTYGNGMFLDTLAMFIPRILWNNKPLAVDFTMPTALENSVGYDNLHSYAMAWPNIAEYYMDFGILGTFTIMFLLGLFIKKSLKYYYNNNISNIIVYSILFSLTIQIVSRGFTAGNFGIVLFLLIPIYFINKSIKS